MGLFSDVLLTVDFDRTLTAPDSTIPERNIEAIRWFIDNGGAFTVNTAAQALKQAATKCIFLTQTAKRLELRDLSMINVIHLQTLTRQSTKTLTRLKI